MLKNERGFSMTFVFLILVIILVAAWIVPGYLKIHNLAQQKATRGDLENLRKGVNLYFLQRGRYPYSLEDLEPNYVHPFPYVRLGLLGYPLTRSVTRVMVDSGMWFYDENTGEVKIDCTASDRDGEVIKDW
jgi:competence protein ComGC